MLRRSRGAAAVLAGVLAACTDDPSAVQVFAAASTANAVEAALEGTSARVNSAATSALARQIEAGAPADIFLSADHLWMDWLEERGRVEPGTRVDALSNRLALISLREDIDLETFTGRLAVAGPDHVPAGRHAKAAAHPPQEREREIRHSSSDAAGADKVAGEDEQWRREQSEAVQPLEHGAADIGEREIEDELHADDP